VVVLAVCVVIFGALGVLTVRNAQAEIGKAVREGLTAELARAIPREGDEPVAPGEYVITAEDLRRRLAPVVEGGGDQSLGVTITPAGIAFELASQGQVFIIRGRPVAVEGRLAMREMASNHPGIDLVLPPEQVGQAIAGGVNDYLVSVGLRLEEVKLGEGELTLVTDAAD
jgi:hypothetical protein